MAAVFGPYARLYAVTIVGVTTVLGTALVDPPFGGAAIGFAAGVLALLIVAFAGASAVRGSRKAGRGRGRTNMPRNATTRLSEAPLDEAIKRLADALSPRQIILFGSHVYGEPTADSDIDLLIVVDEASQLTIEFQKRAHACLDGSFLPFELHFRSRQNFERRKRIRTSLEHEVSTRGRVLYGA